MCDLIGYTRSVTDDSGKEKVLMFLRGTSRYEAGSRFKYTPDYIELSYNNLVKAIGDAIDKQMAEDGAELFTEERQNAYIDTSSNLDFDTLMKEFEEIIMSIPGANDPERTTPEGEKFAEYWQPRITHCIERYLGKGKKIRDANMSQVEAIMLINIELKDLISKETDK